MLYFELPTDDLPDKATLEISAKNILGAAEQDGEIINFADGAEASVEIPIKNAEPTEVEQLGTDADHYDAGEGSSVVSPIFKDLKLTNPAQCTDVTYEVEIELRAGWTDGFETLTYSWITHDEELNKQVNIYVPEGTVNEEVDIRYSVSTSDTYGGWELDPISRNSLFSVTNEETCLECREYPCECCNECDQYPCECCDDCGDYPCTCHYCDSCNRYPCECCLKCGNPPANCICPPGDDPMREPVDDEGEDL